MMPDCGRRRVVSGRLMMIVGRLRFHTARLFLVIAAFAVGGSAHAEPRGGETAARARALVSEAKQLLASAQVEEACRKLAEAEALAPSGATLMQLAACEEAAGRTATALATYRRARAMSGRELRGAKARAL